MRTFLLIFFLIFSLKLAYSCSCEIKDDQYYDFIALVTICNNEPDSFMYYSGSGYRSEFQIIEHYKGPELTHVLAAGNVNFASEAACEELFSPCEEWIIRAKFSSEENNFITSLCSHNLRYKDSEGMKNFQYRNPEKKRIHYQQKYLGKKPWKFFGDTLIQRFPNGNIEFVEPHKEGQLHGTVKRFYPSGKLYRIENYKNGTLHGEQKWFNEEGFIPSISNYKSGRRHGLWEWYYPNGMPYKRKIYHHEKAELSEGFFWKTNILKRKESYDFSTCTKETKRWSENGILVYHSFYYHNGNSETWNFDFRGNLKSYHFWNSQKKQSVRSKF